MYIAGCRTYRVQPVYSPVSARNPTRMSPESNLESPTARARARARARAGARAVGRESGEYPGSGRVESTQYPPPVHIPYPVSRYHINRAAGAGSPGRVGRPCTVPLDVAAGGAACTPPGVSVLQFCSVVRRVYCPFMVSWKQCYRIPLFLLFLESVSIKS